MAFTHVVAYVEVFHTSPRDGEPLDRVVVPVILGERIVTGYTTLKDATEGRGIRGNGV